MRAFHSRFCIDLVFVAVYSFCIICVYWLCPSIVIVNEPSYIAQINTSIARELQGRSVLFARELCALCKGVREWLEISKGWDCSSYNWHLPYNYQHQTWNLHLQPNKLNEPNEGTNERPTLNRTRTQYNGMNIIHCRKI